MITGTAEFYVRWERKYELKAKLQKNIEKLEKQARNEKQPNKKFQLASQVKALKKQLAELDRKD